MRTHELRTIDHYFEAIERGEKTFEVRRNDRAFQTGDVLKLVKIREPHGNYVMVDGEPLAIYRKITYLLQGGQFGIEPAFCVLGLGPLD